MRKIYLIPLAIVGALIIAAAVETGLATAGRKSGPVNQTPPPQALQHLVTHAPESTPPPTSCVFLGDPSNPLSMEISQKYGELRNCLLFDNSWVILTEGLLRQNGTRLSGVVAMYRCAPSDATCLNNQYDHPLTGWQIIQPPCPGELSLGPDTLPGNLQIMGTCAYYFDISTGIFSDK